MRYVGLSFGPAAILFLRAGKPVQSLDHGGFGFGATAQFINDLATLGVAEWIFTQTVCAAKGAAALRRVGLYHAADTRAADLLRGGSAGHAQAQCDEGNGEKGKGSCIGLVVHSVCSVQSILKDGFVNHEVTEDSGWWEVGQKKTGQIAGVKLGLEPGGLFKLIEGSLVESHNDFVAGDDNWNSAAPLDAGVLGFFGDHGAGLLVSVNIFPHKVDAL